MEKSADAGINLVPDKETQSGTEYCTLVRAATIWYGTELTNAVMPMPAALASIPKLGYVIVQIFSIIPDINLTPFVFAKNGAESKWPLLEHNFKGCGTSIL
jgi:hypothetical protein